MCTMHRERAARETPVPSQEWLALRRRVGRAQDWLGSGVGDAEGTLLTS